MIKKLNFYLGAYYLLKLKALEFGDYKGKKVFSACCTINTSYFDAWSLSWTEDGIYELETPKREFSISEDQIKNIQHWCDEKFNEKILGWVNTFNNLQSVYEYKNLFFNTSDNTEILGVYFSEEDIEKVTKYLSPGSDEEGEVGMLVNLNEKVVEDKNKGLFIGYDLIGMNKSGDYESIHCFGILKELVEKFDLEINEKGLISTIQNKNELMTYANSTESGLPTVPWFLVKIRHFSSSN